MIVAAAITIERIAPLEQSPGDAGFRFFAVGEVCDIYGLDRGRVVAELVRRRELRAKPH